MQSDLPPQRQDDPTKATTPQAILQRYFAAMNAGDAQGALALFADDAVRLDTAVPEQVKAGKAAIAPGLLARVADHIQIESSEYQAEGNCARCLATVWTDYGRRLGFAPVVEVAEVIVEAGKIKRFAVTVLPESLARIKAAEQRHQAQTLGLGPK
jgi:hypothetical protein